MVKAKEIVKRESVMVKSEIKTEFDSGNTKCIVKHIKKDKIKSIICKTEKKRYTCERCCTEFKHYSSLWKHKHDKVCFPIEERESKYSCSNC